MSRPPPIFSRLRSLFCRAVVERDMAAEMQAHLELQEEANRARGMDAEEARYAALRQFGGVAQVQERCREQRGWGRWEDFGRDLRLAARAARRTPGFAAIVLVTLACGIGAATAVFSGVDAVLLRPLPVRAPGELVVAAASGPVRDARAFPYPLYDKKGDNRPFPYAFYTVFRERCSTLTDVVAVTGWPTQRSVLASGFGATEPCSAVVEEVSGNYFGALGVPLARGRGLFEADDGPGDVVPVAVVSHDFWQGRLGADPDVVGKTVHLDGQPVTIVGVAGRGFTGAQVGLRCDLWFPIRWSPALDANMPWGPQVLQNERQPLVHILGRLRRGVSRPQAAAELDGLFQQKLAELDPRRQAAADAPVWAALLEQHLTLASARTGYAGVRSELRTAINVLLALAAVLQLAACANVAGLLLARGAAREREFAVRTALGASRGRVVRQLLTECLFLTVPAGGLGLLVALGARRFLQGAAQGVELSLDVRVLAFAGTLTLLSAFGAGLLPAWRLSRRRAGGGVPMMAAARPRLNTALVGVQVGFAFVLLVVAGLFVRTLRNIVATDTGYARENRLLFDVGLAPETPPARRAQIYQQMATELAAIGGVQSVSYYQGIDLLGDTAFVLDFDVPGAAPVPGPPRRASLVHVGPRFFETMGVPLLRGRDFGARDDGAMASGSLAGQGGTNDAADFARRDPVIHSGNGVPALVIGAWTARQLFGDTDPLGRRIRLNGRWEFEVVGVAADVKYGALRDDPRYLFFMAASVTPNAMRMTFAVQAAGASAVLAGGLRAAVQRVDAGAQLSGFRTVAERLAGATARERFTARLAGFFGFFALTLSGLGLFGLLSFAVNRRLREIGIRMALGAPMGGILVLVGRGAVVAWAAGCALGLVVALALARWIRDLLFQVPAEDPVTYAWAAVALLAVAGLASLRPAWRSARVDPAAVLRAE